MRTDASGTLPRKQLTARGWQALVLSIMGVLVLAGAVLGGLLLEHADEVSRELRDDVQPARVAAAQPQAAVRDQETGTRGYLLTADPQFLKPYYDGQRAERAAADFIRSRLGRHPDLIADLDAIEAAATEWRNSYAEPVIAALRANNAAFTKNADLTDHGKTLFDGLRGLFDTQTAHLTEARNQATASLQRVNDWRDRVLASMVVTFFVTAAALGLLINRAVSKPLASLAASCRQVTEGHFGDAIKLPRRPADIRGIAYDVEGMRQRIVQALEASRAAQAQLDEQAADLRRSNAELEQFAYVASHDLQEPLRKVASFCTLLERRYRDKLDDRGVEYIDFAVDGAKRMQVLINDLLSFSRVGRLNAKYTAVELDTALDSAVANLAVAIEESGAEIVRPARPLPRVNGDPTLLVVLWQNLIGNAVKFHREGVPPRITIEFRRGTGSRENLWVFSVSDNGIGIAEEFVDKVFIIFQRLHGRDAYGGTGLGLAMCKKIVEHQGTVWIDTSYTDGTRFEFTLPVAELNAEPIGGAVR